MTSAGQITLGVDLDADDLTARLGEAVRRAIAPALEDIQRQLNKVQREQEKTARVTQREAAKMAAAEHALGEAVEQVGQEHTKQAAKATAAGGVTTRQINSVTRALNKQAAAWAAVAAAQSAAAAAPQPTGPPPGRGGGGGGGGGSPGANAGGFMRGGKGTFGFFTSPVGLNLGALGASALPAAATAVVNLTGAVQALGQAGLVLPGIFAGVASSVGVAALGFQGLADAYKSFDPTLGPVAAKKAAAAFAELGPNTQALLTQVNALSKEFDGLKQTVQEKMFAGLDAEISALSDKAAPRLRDGIGKIADAWNGTLKTITGSLGSEKNLSIMDRIFGNTAEGQKRANAAIDPLIHGFGTLAAAGTDFLPRLADGLTKLATRFDDFITKADGDGRLAGWIDTGFKAAANFGEALLNIGKIITNITGAAGGDGGFLKWLRDVTAGFAEFTGSAEGQEKLSNFFREGKERLDQWLPVLADLARLAGDVIAGFQRWGDIILPIIGGILDALTMLGGSGGGIIGSVVTGFLALKTLGGLGSLLSSLTGINTQLGGIAGSAGTISKSGGLAGILSGGKGLGALLGGGLALNGFNDANQNGAGLGNAAMTVGGAALTGFAVGGPWGALIAGVGGAVVALGQFAQNLADTANENPFTKAKENLPPSDVPQYAGVPGDNRFSAPPVRPGAVPTVNDDLRAFLQSQGGNVQGFTIAPDGSIIGPNGQRAAAPIPIPAPPLPPPQVIRNPSPVVQQAPNVTMPKDLGGLLGANPSPVTPPGPAIAQTPVVTAPKIDAGPAKQTIADLKTEITSLPEGKVQIKDATPEVLENVKKLDTSITELPEGKVEIKANTAEAQQQLDRLIRDYQSRQITLRIQTSGAAVPPPVPRATGGPIWGGVPGRDSVPIMAMPGEHMLTVADVNALGGQQGVYAMRAALHGARGYDQGGVVNKGWWEEWRKKQRADLASQMPVPLPGQATLGGASRAPSAMPIGQPSINFGQGPTPVEKIWDGFAGEAKQTFGQLTEAVSNPQAAGNSVAALGGIGPAGSPGVLESWKAVGKAVTHWDQWADDPFGAAGATLFDVATASIGSVSELLKPVSTAIGNAAQASEASDVIRQREEELKKQRLLAGGKAAGGVLPGYSPGVDNMLVPLSGGEGILIPEAVRGIGGAAGVYAINSMFRSGLSKQGYADGGVHLGTGLPPGPVPPNDSSELGVLMQIRDLLAGKGNTGPLVDTADAVSTIAKDGTASTATGGGKSGEVLGPFGTPLKKRGNPAYEMAAAAISALGGDPEKFIGMDPSTYVGTGGIAPAAGTGVGGIDPTRYTAALTAFAMSGNVADVAGAGLDANDPVVKAIVTARNKKKGGLSDEQIAGLVGDVFDGGYTGTLDDTNSGLVGSLQTYREKLAKQGGARGTATTSTLAAGSMTPLPGAVMPTGPGATSGVEGLLPAADALAKAVRAAYPVITEIGGVRSDAHPDHPSGRALDIMIPGGTVRGGVNPEGEALGDQLFQQLINSGMIDPDGSLWKTDTGGDHYNHIHARIAEGMENALPGALGGLGVAGMPGTSAGGLPGGTGSGAPVYVTNWPGAGNGMPPGAQQVLDGAFAGVGEAANNVIGDTMKGVSSGFFAQGDGTRASSAILDTLVRERNPLALAKALGLDVQDFTREGGQGGEFEKKDGPAFDPSGRIFSDTAALSDRTTTDLTAQIAAMREQLVDVIEQVSQKLNDQALEPVVKAGVQSALESLKDSVSAAIGTAMGNAAGPVIAEAVGSAVSALPIDNSGAGGGNLANPGALVGALFADGGPVAGGTPGRDSVPAMLMPGEHVFTSSDVARMGGQAGVYAFRNALQNGRVRGFATGGGVIGNDTVGADFFGVSQIPIIGTIVNMLVRVLLKVIGLDIEVRDTLQEMSGDFRQFRGDAFKAFDAQGRLLNDTSALIDRSQSSQQAVADERIRILKLVIDAIIKYIIEKVVVPIGKAVANAAIQAGASAAGAAVNTQAPGAGGIVSSLISSAGQAGVEIAAEVGTDFALSISETLIGMVTEGLQGLFPDLMTGLFSGGFFEMLLNPLGSIFGDLFGQIFGGFGGILGGISLPGMGVFDEGGIARGKGFMPKAVDADELVLSPGETELFPRLVAALENGGFGSTRTTTIHAPFTVVGGREAGEQARDRLLALMP